MDKNTQGRIRACVNGTECGQIYTGRLESGAEVHMSLWERGAHSGAWSGVQKGGLGYIVGMGRSTQVQAGAHVDRKGVSRYTQDVMISGVHIAGWRQMYTGHG